MSEKLIFIVEDDPAILMVLVAALRHMDCFVFPFRAGQEALSALDAQPPDAVICDYNLPDMNGIEFLFAVSSKASTICRIMSTAGYNTDCVSEALDCGAAQAVMEKPFSKKTLARVLRAIELRGVDVVIQYEPCGTKRDGVRVPVVSDRSPDQDHPYRISVDRACHPS